MEEKNISLDNVDFEELNKTFNESVREERMKKEASFKKKATLGVNIPFGDMMGSSTSRVPLYFQDPTQDAFFRLLPKKDPKLMYRLYRHYRDNHPIVGSCVDIHSSFPLSDFELTVDEPEVKEYYNYVSDNLGLLNIFEQQLNDTVTLGDSIHIGNFDMGNMEWSSFVQYPPEYIQFYKLLDSKEAVYILEPDESLKEAINSNTSGNIYKEILEKVNDKYLEAILGDKNYQLDSDKVLHVSNKKTGYMKRGTSLIDRALQDLMYEDNLRTLQHTIVQRHTYPLIIYKLGSRELKWVPSQSHFEQFKRLLVRATADPAFSLVYHFGVEVDYVTTKDKVLDLKPEFEFTTKRIMNAFFVNDALINGEAPSYAGQTANVRLLMHRFMNSRKQLTEIAKNKIFYQIARFQNLVRRSTGEAKKNVIVKSKSFRKDSYYLPDFLFFKQNLLNATSERQFLMQLYQQGDIPWGIIRDVFGLDQKIVDRYRMDDQGTMSDKLTREVIDQTVKDDPSLSLSYVLGEDPIEILHKKLDKVKLTEGNGAQGEDTDSDMGGDLGGGIGGGDLENFDSSAPIDLPTPESGDEGTEALPQEGEPS